LQVDSGGEGTIPTFLTRHPPYGGFPDSVLNR